MERDQERQIEIDCQRTIIRFFNRLDGRDYDGLVALLAPDGVWHRRGQPLQGREAVMAAMRARSETLLINHLVSNLEVAVVSASEATARSIVTVYNDPGKNGTDLPRPLVGPWSVYEFTQILRPDGDTWLIAEQKSRVLFKRMEG